MQQTVEIGAPPPFAATARAIGQQANLEVSVANFSSATLARLVEEVRNEDLPGATKYDRTYNRHNR